MALRTLPNLLCGALFFLAAADPASNKKVSVKEVVFDSPIVDLKWMGPTHKIVLCQTNKGLLYRSTNSGETWNNIMDSLQPSSSATMGFTVDQIITSPADANTVMVAGAHHEHFVSLDAGATWKKVQMKSKVHTFIFHPTRAKWALLSTWTLSCDNPSKKKQDDDDVPPCTHQLYITKDMGRSFSLVASYIVQFSWGDPEHKQEDRIYFTHFRQKKGDQPRLTLWSSKVDFGYTDNAGGRVVELLLRRGNKFRALKGYIFVAQLADDTKQTVKLMVSSDGGRTFNMAQLPQELEEKSYSILDTSEGTVMLHVNHNGGSSQYPVGNIYVSDKEGVRFSLSLPNNVRTSSGECEFDKIVGVDGVYMANFRDLPRDQEAVDPTKAGESTKGDAEADEDMEDAQGGTEVDRRRSSRAKGKDESLVRTVISFDKGGAWSYLRPPKVDSLGKPIECPPDKCWLHLHGHARFRNYAPFYSLENAIGIIMGTGNVGPYLRFEPDQVNTYLSRDGGLTWSEAHKGAFIYEYGDHGGLMVMADDMRKTKQVVFSWNEGQSWYDFDLSELPVEVDNILTEPNSTSTKFLLYGTRSDAGVIYFMDFEALGQPLCKGVWAADSVSSDYETWSPSDGRSSEKCLLGRQVTYTRRKATSECFNGEQFERPVSRKNCACTEEDYECEVGFARKVNSLECKISDYAQIAAPEKCTTMDSFKVSAHRKVVGDSCEGGWQPEKARVPCPMGSKLSRGAMSVLGSISMVVTIMAAVTYASRSETFKGWFANYGFDQFTAVKYAGIGQRAPESALDSVGARYDMDFIEGDQDDYADDAPQLMTYTRGGDRDRDRDRDREARSEAPRRVDTAAAPVPKLQAPPGSKDLAKGAPGDDDGVDLL